MSKSTINANNTTHPNVSNIDTLRLNNIDTLRLDANGLDSSQTDSLRESIDSISRSAIHQSKNISKEAIDQKILSNAVDSTVIDHIDEKMFLYGNAVVKYQTMELKAGKIIIDYKLNEATAYPREDSIGRTVEKPHFKDGENEFTCDKLRYNFDSKKGMVYEARTTESDLYVHGSRTKFISKDADTLLQDDIVYTENALVTSCDADHPHFGIFANKLKVIPGKVAVVGPSWLKIMDIPLVPLPFGFFPMNEGRSTGLIFPKDFSVTPTARDGIRINGLGWYFPINENLDLQVMTDFSSRGNWGLRTITRYDVRYKYSGSLNLNYSVRYTEDNKGIRYRTPAFAIRLNHTQDSKAHPYRKISGSIDISTSGYHKKDNHDVSTQFKNEYTSNFGLSYNVPNSPLSFNLSMRHSQNTKTKIINLSLPIASMRLSTIYPFKSSKPGKKKWYEKISFAYDSEISNKITSSDSTLFTQQTLDNMQNGMKHKASTGVDFKLFKYFNLNLNASINENWTLKTLNRYLNDSLVIKKDSLFDELNRSDFIGFKIDTLQEGVVVDEIKNGFAAQRTINTSANLSWKWFGTYQRQKGYFRGIRHTISPRIGLSFNPDSRSQFEKSYLSPLINSEQDTTYYNPFEKAAYRSSLRPKGFNITYGFTNIFEAKLFSKKDSTFKKIKLFKSISVNGSYNVAADSLNWSAITISANTPLFWGFSSLSISGKLDPYKEVNGRRVNTLVANINPFKGKIVLPEIEYLNFRLSTGTTISEIFNLFSKNNSNQDKTKKNSKSRKQKKSNKKSNDISHRGIDNDSDTDKKNFKAAPTKFSSLFERFRIDHEISYIMSRYDDIDSSFIKSHSIKIRGTFPISENWDFTLGNIGYDFIKKSVSYPQLGFRRNLHCWQMSFNWYPSNDSFSFDIGVISSTLGFLKKNYGKNQPSGSFY